MRRDDILLVDMLLAARRALEFLSAVSQADFEADTMRQFAVMKAIEIIGEAADRVSESFRQAHPELPWRDMVGMRHRLVHGYFHVDLPKVWETVHQDIPALIAALEPLVPPEEN